MPSIKITHGGAYGMQSLFLEKGWFGGLVMDALYIFGVISGYP